jgi:hypothetical protein
MSQSIAPENSELNMRRKQAIELGIKVTDCMSLECIENEIAKKLNQGMKELKSIMDDINNISFEL